MSNRGRRDKIRRIKKQKKRKRKEIEAPTLRAKLYIHVLEK